MSMLFYKILGFQKMSFKVVSFRLDDQQCAFFLFLRFSVAFFFYYMKLTKAINLYLKSNTTKKDADEVFALTTSPRINPTKNSSVYSIYIAAMVLKPCEIGGTTLSICAKIIRLPIVFCREICTRP